MEIRKLTVYTDGSCNKQKQGGYGYALVTENEVLAAGGAGIPDTTNNRMEMTAVISPLNGLLDEARREEWGIEHLQEVEVISDSQYVIKGVTEWMPGWKKRGWKNSANKVVENLDLWKEVDYLIQAFSEINIRIRWSWVRGHNGDSGNEVVDKIAQYHSTKDPKFKKQLDDWFEKFQQELRAS